MVPMADIGTLEISFCGKRTYPIYPDQDSTAKE